MVRRGSVCIMLFALAAVLILPGAFPAATAVSDPEAIVVYWNDVVLEFEVPPHFCRDEPGEPMIPLRRIAEKLGFSVLWEAESRQITLEDADHVIALSPGDPFYAINERIYRASRTPFIVKGRTMVGLDFIQKMSRVDAVSWEQANQRVDIIVNERKSANKPVEKPPEGGKKQPHLLEVLLPPGNSAAAGQSFQFQISAPFVKGIHAYEISFFYNPGLIRIKEIKNPAYDQEKEFYRKHIANVEGTTSYTLTTLGFLKEIPPRQTLAIFEAEVLREGAVPFNEHTLKITLLDNKAATMPISFAAKTLYIKN